jgi:hypothetical protein
MNINKVVRLFKDRGLNLLSFADDTAHSFGISQLRNAILSFIEYFKERKMVLSLEKCKLKFTRVIVAHVKRHFRNK